MLDVPCDFDSGPRSVTVLEITPKTPNLWNENVNSTANRRENVCLVSLVPANAGRLQQVRRAN